VEQGTSHDDAGWWGMHIGVRYDLDSVGVSSRGWTKALSVMLQVGAACITTYGFERDSREGDVCICLLPVC
jgi:hypothetical protein